jgi:type I restriction enzyme R subunit
VLDWRKRQQSRAPVRVFTEDMILQLPEGYIEEVCGEKSAIICQHVYDSYWGADRSIDSRIVAVA